MVKVNQPNYSYSFLRKEEIQPQVLLRLPCYEFTPITDPTLDCCLLSVSPQASGVANSHGVTGGVYKTRERIHRDILIRVKVNQPNYSYSFLRKELLQPQVLLRLPCYDFTPITDPTLDGCLLSGSPQASGGANAHGVTGGVYKTRERIHRDILIRDY